MSNQDKPKRELARPFDVYLKTLEALQQEETMATPTTDETEQACMCAAQQAAQDMPYVEVVEVRPYQYHSQSHRWYVDVDLQHHNPDEGTATALYRVWIRDGNMVAIKVDIVATESEE